VWLERLCGNFPLVSRQNIFLLNNLAQRGYLTFAQGNGSNIVFDATRTVRVAQKARIDQGGF
jgi:hypothetical protein